MADILLNLSINTGTTAGNLNEINDKLKVLREEVRKSGKANVNQTKEISKLTEARKVYATVLRNESKQNISNANTIAKVRARVNELKQRIEQVDTSTKKGVAQFEKYRKELVQGETKLRDFNQQLGRGRTFVGEYGKGFLEAGKNLAGMLGVGLGVAALTKSFGAAVNTFKDFEQSNANLAAVLGKNIDSISVLTADAKRLGSSTKFTASEVSNLQTEFAKLGFVEDQILSITEATLDLAAASGSDLNQASKVAGSTIRAFGLEAEDAQRVVDVMAKSFSSSSLDITKFETAMRAVAPVAKNAGLTIEETTALIGTLTDRGIDASTAGTGLRNVFLELAKQGLTFEEAMNKINNASDKNAVSLELFGKRGAVIGTILSETGEDVDNLTKSLNNAGGAAQRMAETQLDTLSGSVTILNSAWEGFILGLEDGGGLLNDLIRGFVDLGTEILGFLTLQDKASDSVAELNAGFNIEIETLKRANLTQEQRKDLIEDINFKYGDYLDNLLTEKSSIEDIEAAQLSANQAFSQRITLLAAQEELAEITKKSVEAQREVLSLEKRQQRLIKEKAEAEADFEKNVGRSRQGVAKSTIAQQQIELVQARIAEQQRFIKENQEDYNKLISSVPDLLNKSTTANKKFVDSLSVTGGGDEVVKEGKPKKTEAEKEAERLAKAQERLQAKALEDANIVENEFIRRLIGQNDFEISLEEQKFARLIEARRLAGEDTLVLEEELAIRKQEINDKFLLQEEGVVKETQGTKEELRKIEQDQIQANLQSATSSLGQFAAAAKQGSTAQKALQSAQALINTYAAATAALAPPPVGAGPIFGPIAAGAAIASGLANVARINNVKLAKGGVLSGPSHSQGGIPFSVGGQGGFEAEGGEAIINKRSTSMFAPLLSAINSFSGFGRKFQDGGVVSAPISAPSLGGSSSATSIFNTEELARMIGNAVSENTNIVLPVESLSEVQNNVEVIENTVTF